MDSVAFELPEPAISSVHTLRRSFEGIHYLQESGKFKPYMQEWVNSKNRPFMSWDGEGWTDTDGEHRYYLLQCSNGANISAPRLNSIECLEFILGIAADNPKVIHVGYGFGYDTAHILRDMPQELREKLKETGAVSWFVQPSEFGPKNQYKFEYIPHKWFTITGYNWNLRKNVTLKIYDVMTFFQSSFIAALQSRNIPVPEEITSGKAGRADFKYSDLDEVRHYCQLELEATIVLMNRLRGEFQEANLAVTKWHGPGAVADVIFKANRINKHMREPELHIERAAQMAYFGGRFEQFKAGHYSGKVYLYDINSAYPHKIRDLPSLDGAYWERVERFLPGEFGVYLCSYDSNGMAGTAPHPTPWRGKGGVVGFPAINSNVWLWHPEAQFATQVHYGFVLRKASDAKPFAFVQQMYDIRRQWKKEGKGGERAYKLALNSLYGKMAQRVGGSEKHSGRPPWHQLEWAGAVTSAVRAQIWEAVAQAPDQIIAVETDSVASMVPLDLPISEELGDWEVKEYDWMTYVQSGIYFASNGKTGDKARTRGIDVKQLSHDDILRFMDGKHDGPLLVKTRQFNGLTSVNKWNYGNWQDGVKEVKIAGEKRIHATGNCASCDAGLSMATHMHNLTANPAYGIADSYRHPLPWLDNEYVPDYDLTKVSTEAIADWETSTRHNGMDGNLADIPF
jgi:hypothetical protein